MKTLLIIWLSMTNGVATNSVQSKDFDSLSDCKDYAEAVMQDAKAISYECFEGYSLSKGKKS